MNRFRFVLKEKQKIIAISIIFVISNLFVYYLQVTADSFFTGFLYISIILSSIWWKRKSLILIIFLEIVLMLIYFILIKDIPIIDILLRVFIFIIVSFIISEIIYTIFSNNKEMKSNYNQLDQVFNAVGNGLRIIDKDYNILRVNKTFIDFSGLTQDEILSKKCYEVFPSSVCNTSNCCLRKILIEKKPFEIDSIRKLEDGSDFYCILHTVPYYGENGEFIGIIEDCKPITKRKQLENKLIETSNYLKNLIDYASAPIIVWNPELKITKFNHASELLTGYKKEEILGKEICTLFPQESKRKSMDCIKLTKKGQFLESIEILILCKNGNVKTVLWNSSNIYGKDFVDHLATVAQGQDITERKLTQEKILKTIFKTEEKERTRFAKDLHDGLGTLLSSINIYLSLIKSGDLEEIEKKNIVNFAKALIDEAILNTKEIANNLKPNIISRFGLVPSLQSFCKKVNETGVINISFNSDIKKDINKESEVALFRIIKELINNTLKHASASKIDINITDDENVLIFDFQDNGIGFDTNKIIDQEETDGTGIQNIISRIKTINGSYVIESNKKQGTKFVIKI